MCISVSACQPSLVGWVQTSHLEIFCHPNGHLFKLGLANNPWCGRCKLAIETAFHILCDRAALATLRFRHLGKNMMKQCDFEKIPVSTITQKDRTKDCKCSLCRGLYNAHPHVFYSTSSFPRHKILSQAIKFIHMMLKISLIC